LIIIEKRKRFFWIFAFSIQLFLLAMTMSRTTLICLFSVGVFAWFLRFIRDQKRLRGAVVIVAVYGSILFIFLLSLYLETLLEFLGRDLTLTGRTTIWQAAFLYWTSSPWFGHGYQASWRVYEGMPSYVELVAGWEFNPSHSHNAYIDVALGVGSIGLVLYLLWVAKVFANGVASILKGADLAAWWGLVSLLVISLIGFSGRVILQPNTIQLVIVVMAALFISERGGVNKQYRYSSRTGI
jgi:O-antigen ligase